MRVSKSEITLSSIALGIGVLVATSAWIEHGTPVPFLREIGRSAVVGILLWMALDHASQKRHRESRVEIGRRVDRVEHKVDHVVTAEQHTAASLRSIAERADGGDETGPMNPLRFYN